MKHGEQYPVAVENVIDMFNGLPGIGRRTAVRIAMAILKWQPERINQFGKILQDLPNTLGYCKICGNLSSLGELCRICSSCSRDTGIICVVEEFSQIISIESSAVYNGLYHVLGGKLSPLSDQMAETLSIQPLLERLNQQGITEVILALSQNVEGQATAVYLSDILKGRKLKVTRLARGLPAGSDIAYADSATIGAALNGRIAMRDSSEV
jgi:recombination protein RecR